MSSLVIHQEPPLAYSLAVAIDQAEHRLMDLDILLQGRREDVNRAMDLVHEAEVERDRAAVHLQQLLAWWAAEDQGAM